EQMFTVPAGVTSVHVVAKGASGGNAGGKGAVVSGDVAVAEGDTLYVEVGGGSDFNGGGAPPLEGAGVGGGASDVRTITRTAPGTLGSRLLVAAGGGGGGAAFGAGPNSAFSPGGAGGDAGTAGTDGPAAPGTGGGAGTTSSGGSKGASSGTSG